ncbi:hypothetical protein CK505_13755 [Kocuria sp. WN036]|uniref:glycosyltransferase family 2 protein n=1 Tax=Kocuria sp. WN036 TaxID=2032628 RepID=UPI000BABFCE6|nr:glycosyltransferase family 2 protein [Kocuria sp. WN036]PAU89273.1 hypothetical protein CK505_13755 [Kocuria sp. WN036]
MVNIGILIASYNRKDATLECLSILKQCELVAAVNSTTVLFDDGSTDGTSVAIEKYFPDVHIVHGNGDAFWAHSMAQAEKYLMSISDDIDYILWLNDDVKLDPNSIERLITCSERNRNSIIVGAVREPGTHRASYGGFRQHPTKPLKFLSVNPGPHDLVVDTFNGNVVLVPISAARTIGGIDGSYAHALADIDYGMRGRALGISSILAPLTFGDCPRNPTPPWRGIRSEFRAFTNKKGGGHPSSLMRILRKIRPTTWPAHFASIYMSWVYKASKRQIKLYIAQYQK